MARPLTRAAAMVVSLLAVSGAGGAASQQAPKRGGTVVVGVPAQLEPPCFNPLVQSCFERGGALLFQMLDGPIFARPFEVGPGSTFQPDLVSRVTVEKRPFTLTYHIRPRARWSDGVPVSARDFEFTYRAISATPHVWHDHPFRTIRRTRTIDAKTFRVVFRAPLPVSVWKQFFVLLAPSHALSGVGLQSFSLETVVDPRTGKPIGSGPFLMHSRQRGRQVTFVRNPGYWAGRTAYVDRIVFRFLPTVELGDALRGGAIDVILPTPASEAIVQDVRARPTPDVRVVSHPSPFWEHLAIRSGGGAHPALRDKRVRRALAYGVDRLALVRTLERRVFGRSTPRLQPLESVVAMPSSPTYEANWSGYRSRPSEARRLLESARCRRGPDGIHVCEGRRLSLAVATTSGAERRQLILEVLQQQLGRLGVEVRPQFFAGLSPIRQALREGMADVALFSWEHDVNELRARFGCGGSDNYTGHCSRLATRELGNAERVLDDSSQARALNRADRLLARDVPVLPLFQIPNLVALRVGIRNFDPETLLRTAENWWLDR